VRAAFEIHFQAGPLQSYIRRKSAMPRKNFGAVMKPNFEIERGPSQRKRSALGFADPIFRACSYAFPDSSSNTTATSSSFSATPVRGRQPVN
jgi:hypothetical protein